MNLFGFLDMQDTYEERKVDRYDGKDTDGNALMVSTALVTDSAHPYETAVQHPEYDAGKYIIVEMYDTKETAQVGHDKWLKLMRDARPAILEDRGTAAVAELCDMTSASDWRVHPRTEVQ